MPINIPADVTVKMDGNTITVKGKLGELSREVHSDMIVNIEDNVITVGRPSDNRTHRSLHGLTRTLISNMVDGVDKGFEKALEINGTGYRAAKQGTKLVLTLGYSHLVEMEEPSGITYEVPEQTKIIVKGIDKQQVGEYAAQVRSKRKPEPYHGKGIKYANEHIRRKEGKTGA
jgi:large subunit ribosomal protein L6